MPAPRDDDDGDEREYFGQRYGAVLAEVRADGSGYGGVVGDEVRPQPLSSAQLTALTAVTGSTEASTVRLPGLGTYRALAQPAPTAATSSRPCPPRCSTTP